MLRVRGFIFFKILAFPSPFIDAILQNVHKNKAMEIQLLTDCTVDKMDSFVFVPDLSVLK